MNAVGTQTRGKAPPVQGQAAELKDLVARYRLSNQVEGKSPKTVAWYDEMLRAFLLYLEKQATRLDLSSFNIDTVRAYVLHLQQKRRYEGHPGTPAGAALVSPRTVQCHVRTLRAFASWLQREGYTEKNRLGNLKLPKAPVKVIEPLTAEEIKKVTAIDKTSPLGERNRAIVALAMDTGLRSGEIAGLTLAGVNLKAGLLKVMGKGSKERVVPIGKFVQMTLRHYIKNARPKPADASIDRLFLTRDGQPLTTNALKLVFSRLADRTGVTRLHAHLCRHTFATSYLMNGGDIFSLRGILGHTTFEMVNHYLHFTTAQITEQHQKYSPLDNLKSQK